MEAILSGRDLNKTYTDYSRGAKHCVRPLQHVDFDLFRGEILGVVGESGSGKSTLLNVISGLEKAEGGSLLYKGSEYTGSGPEKTGRFLQMVFQDAYGSFDPRMTIERSLSEAPGAEQKEIRRIIREVGLDEELLKRKPRRLSGGQCQRMSIARALASHAEVLLCDEITSALDVTTQAQVIKIITELRDSEGVSVIFVSHDLALVSMICDRIMVMKDGVVVETGKTEDVITKPKHEYTERLLESIITTD